MICVLGISRDRELTFTFNVRVSNLEMVGLPLDEHYQEPQRKVLRQIGPTAYRFYRFIRRAKSLVTDFKLYKQKFTIVVEKTADRKQVIEYICSSFKRAYRLGENGLFIIQQ